MAILDEWGYWGVTAHFMDEEFDTGAIIECRHFQIAGNIVNKDLVDITHRWLFSLFKDIIIRIENGNELTVIIQENGKYYSLEDLEKRKLIKENDSIDCVNRKIRAFWNPPYDGAQIEIKGERYTLINEDILK